VAETEQSRAVPCLPLRAELVRQFEYLSGATAKLKVVVPFTLLIIFVLLFLVFGRLDEALLIMGTLPLALIGGFWLLYLLGYNLSVAGIVGFIALAGSQRNSASSCCST
jgi:Cu/Ag efflux pump CusA